MLSKGVSMSPGRPRTALPNDAVWPWVVLRYRYDFEDRWSCAEDNL